MNQIWDVFGEVLCDPFFVRCLCQLQLPRHFEGLCFSVVKPLLCQWRVLFRWNWELGWFGVVFPESHEKTVEQLIEAGPGMRAFFFPTFISSDMSIMDHRFGEVLIVVWTWKVSLAGIHVSSKRSSTKGKAKRKGARAWRLMFSIFPRQPCPDRHLSRWWLGYRGPMGRLKNQDLTDETGGPSTTAAWWRGIPLKRWRFWRTKLKCFIFQSSLFWCSCSWKTKCEWLAANLDNTLGSWLVLWPVTTTPTKIWKTWRKAGCPNVSPISWFVLSTLIMAMGDLWLVSEQEHVYKET